MHRFGLFFSGGGTWEQRKWCVVNKCPIKVDWDYTKKRESHYIVLVYFFRFNWAHYFFITFVIFVQSRCNIVLWCGQPEMPTYIWTHLTPLLMNLFSWSVIILLIECTVYLVNGKLKIPPFLLRIDMWQCGWEWKTVHICRYNVKYTYSEVMTCRTLKSDRVVPCFTCSMLYAV